MTNLNQHLKNGGNCLIECNDGFAVSIGYSKMHYCYPRVDGAESYEAVEVKLCGGECDSLSKYSTAWPDVFGWVPVKLVEQAIDDHGGVNFVAHFGG